MIVTPQLLTGVGGVKAFVSPYVEPINAHLDEYGLLDSPLRLAYFLSQLAHESQGFTRTTENLNYRPEALLDTFNKKRIRISPEQAQLYGRTKEHKANQVMIANIVYAGMNGNGNVASGDGWRFRGRGLIQLTTKNNYQACAKDTGLDCLNRPELIAMSEGAVISAFWFWKSNGINALIDAPYLPTEKDKRPSEVQRLEAVTRKINGGVNGLKERGEFLHNALLLLS